MVAVLGAQQDDARMVEELESRGNADADWKADLVRQRMARRQLFAAGKKMAISPEVCHCGRIVDSLVMIYQLCDDCVTDYVSQVERDEWQNG